MSQAALWLVIIVIGVITFAIRLSFIALLGSRGVPRRLSRVLRFVPPAVLGALIVPELVVQNGALNVSLSNPRLLAGAIAIVVAWRTRNALLTIALGMLAMWLLQGLLR